MIWQSPCIPTSYSTAISSEFGNGTNIFDSDNSESDVTADIPFQSILTQDDLYILENFQLGSHVGNEQVSDAALEQIDNHIKACDAEDRLVMARTLGQTYDAGMMTARGFTLGQMSPLGLAYYAIEELALGNAASEQRVVFELRRQERNNQLITELRQQIQESLDNQAMLEEHKAKFRMSAKEVSDLRAEQASLQRNHRASGLHLPSTSSLMGSPGGWSSRNAPSSHSKSNGLSSGRPLFHPNGRSLTTQSSFIRAKGRGTPTGHHRDSPSAANRSTFMGADKSSSPTPRANGQSWLRK